MKKQGKGLACVLHPSGNKGAGDPSNAAVQLKPDGTYALLIGTVELGQGSTTIMRQVAADALSTPIENIYISNAVDNQAPLSTGSFASRVTLIDTHAVWNACEDLNSKIRGWAAQLWEANPDDIVIENNEVFVRGAKAERCMPMGQLGPAVAWGGDFLVGTGSWQPDVFHDHDPVTGEMTAVAAISYGCCFVEIEVDTETGQIDLLRMANSWEVGKAINPLNVKQQINGGVIIGMGYAMTENTFPYYPNLDFAPVTLGDYFMPTFADYPRELLAGIAEVPCPFGVKGAKGFSEGSSNAPGPAIMTAVHDAVGVWVDEYPISPERLLKAIKAKQAEAVPA